MRSRDYSDPFDGMDDLDRRLRDLENASPLENASVTGGTVRLIRATLRVEAGGSIELVGTLDGEGRFNWGGPWKFDSGDGEIGGNVDLTGILRILGGGKIVLGDIIIDGATGKIRVGNMTIDPSIAGGAVTFQNGAQVFTDASTIQVYKGNGVVQVSDAEVKMQLGGTAIRLTSGHIFASGMATKSAATVPGGFVGAIVHDAGELKRLV